MGASARYAYFNALWDASPHDLIEPRQTDSQQSESAKHL